MSGRDEQRKTIKEVVEETPRICPYCLLEISNKPMMRLHLSLHKRRKDRVWC